MKILSVLIAVLVGTVLWFSLFVVAGIGRMFEDSGLFIILNPIIFFVLPRTTSLFRSGKVLKAVWSLALAPLTFWLNVFLIFLVGYAGDFFKIRGSASTLAFDLAFGLAIGLWPALAAVSVLKAIQKANREE